MSETQFDFSAVEPIKIPVKIGTNEYLLQEASEDAAARYRNKLAQGMRYSEGTLSRIDSIADADPLLLSCCLYSPADKACVPLKIILQWPSRIVRPLVEKLKQISDLDTEEDPLKVALKAAMDRNDSPISYEDFCKFVDGWSQEEKGSKTLAPLFKVLKPSIEELAKNGPKS